jgi:hypothetical protein
LSLILALVILYGFFFLVGVTCPIKFLTGVSCPGCGMSRAEFAFIRGDIRKAFYYHPLFPLPIVVLILLPFREKIPEFIKRIFLLVIIMAFMVVFFWRMFFLDQDIVVFDPWNGLIFRAAGFFVDKIKLLL